MNNVVLIEVDIKEFKSDIYKYYLEIFPKNEQKPLELIKRSYNNGYSRIFKILNNGILVGFMILNRIHENGYVILDYLAILPKYQNMGFGTQALKCLLEQENKSKGIFIEVDKVDLGKDEEENLIRKKRKKFYEKIGFKRLNFDLLLYEVMFMPYIYLNIDAEEKSIINEIWKIYEAIYSPKEISKHCKIIKE